MTLHTECHKTIAELRARCEYLEARLAEVESRSIDAIERLCVELKVTRQQAHLLWLLSDGGTHNRHDLGHEVSPGSESDLANLVTVQLTRLRQRVPWLTIKTHRGVGLSLEGESLARVRGLLKENA